VSRPFLPFPADDHIALTPLSFARTLGLDKGEHVNDQRSNALKLMKIAMIALPIVAAAMPAFAERAYSPQELKNKEIVLDFYQKALNDKDFDAASKYLGKYIQHNPMAADGPEGLRGFLEYLKKNYPQSKSEIKRVMVDGDYVILRVHAIRQPGDRGSAIVDIFRVEDNKIQEHWDSVQPIPETSKNNNTMF
jgi:predicted SnoaL-like aldol condensation-catalyzing enzyme